MEGAGSANREGAFVATVVDTLLQKRPPGESVLRRWRARLSALVAPQAVQWPVLVPVALGLGIFLWFALPHVGQRQAAFLASIALALSGLCGRGAARGWLVAGSLLVAAGIGLAEIRSLSVAAPVLHHRLTSFDMQGVVEEVTDRRGSEAVRIRLRRADDGVRFDVTVAGRVPAFVTPGATIVVPARFEPRRGPTVPGAYDPARRAWFEGVSASGSATGPPRLVEPARAEGLALPLKQLRQAIQRFLERSLPEAAAPVATALVTGSQGAIPHELRQAIILAGLAHLLTVSGFHVGVVAGGAYLMARRGLLLWHGAALRLDTRAIAAGIAVVIAWAYVFLSGANVPALRAGVTISLVMLALGLGRDPFSLRLIAFAAMVVLIVRPESLVSASFQLSFAAVTALVLLANSGPFRRWLGPGEADRWVRAARWAGALVVSSLVAELVLTPIAAAHFGRAGAYGVLANVIAIPLTSFVIMPCLALHLALGAIGLGAVSAPLLAGGIGLLSALATAVAALPGSSLDVPLVAPLAFGLGMSGAILLALLVGPLRLLGLPLLAAGLLMHALAPRPDLFLSGDGRQVGVVGADGVLYLGRGTGRSFVARTWGEAAGTRAMARLEAFPGARCNRDGCLVPVSDGFTLAFLRREDRMSRPDLAALCAHADLAVGVRLEPDVCKPRWLLLDQQALLLKGAVMVDTRRRRLITQADRAGDHPWSPAALPGAQKTLLGTTRWVEPLAE